MKGYLINKQDIEELDIIVKNGGTYYYKKETHILHREEGPAIIEDNYKAWYLDGVNLTEEEFNERMSNNNKGLTEQQIKDAVKASETIGDINITNHLKNQVGGTHYANKKIQPIEYILANELGFCEGNIVKYITRYKDKDGIKDLEKIKQYVDFLIAENGA